MNMKMNMKMNLKMNQKTCDIFCLCIIFHQGKNVRGMLTKKNYF